ncbi:MAG TPA: hypothetical protein DCR46_09565 [Cytophagales bacterium]|nr:hypothetical protein [Cytophagales bacterium]
MVGYFIYFFLKGNSSSFVFLIWATVALVSFWFSKKQPHWAFLGLSGISFVLFFSMKMFINELNHFPHFHVFIAIIFAYLGAGIDGIYWVYKWDRGKKVRTGYDN